MTREERLNGLRVFVVEDETLVAMQLEDMLLDLGCATAGMAMRVSRACEMLLRDGAPDVAILDVNIAGEKVFPVAELLRDMQVPIIFATGYGRSGVPEVWHDRPILQKPYTENEIAEALLLALTTSAAA